MGISSFVIVIDTLCEGWQAQEDAAGSPFLYSTIEEAEAEILDTFTMMNEGREASGEKQVARILRKSLRSLLCQCLSISRVGRQSFMENWWR